jgi:DNA polymerase
VNHCCCGEFSQHGSSRSKDAQDPIAMADGTKLVVTVHPSSLLRIEDEADKRAAYKTFVADLKAAGATKKRS